MFCDSKSGQDREIVQKKIQRTHDNFESVVTIREGSVGANDATSRQRWIRETICARIGTLTKDYWAAFQVWNHGASFHSMSAEWS